ncbi:MAG: pyridine nucleotide-disulfide oxidoreductase, partial [Acidiferrobacterales bacterium]
LAEHEERGLLKLVTHRGKLLGASILGPHAGELVHELVLAMKTGASVATLSATVHAYPTLSQIHRRAANMAFAPTLFSPATRRLVRWLQRLVP